VARLNQASAKRELSVMDAAALCGTKVTFLVNNAGEIDRVSIPLEPSVKEIIFTRKAAKPEPVAAKD
jgi:hypothetical protein